MFIIGIYSFGQAPPASYQSTKGIHHYNSARAKVAVERLFLLGIQYMVLEATVAMGMQDLLW